jgi:Rieske Fe-S protein
MVKMRTVALLALAAALAAGCATITYRTQEALVSAEAYTFAADGSILLELDAVPGLDTVGGAATIEDDRLANHIILARPSEGEFVAASSHCTHRRMALLYDHEEGVFRCSALGKSEFGMDGAVVSGPASRPLAVYETTVEGRTLTIDLDE